MLRTAIGEFAYAALGGLLIFWALGGAAGFWKWGKKAALQATVLWSMVIVITLFIIICVIGAPVEEVLFWAIKPWALGIVGFWLLSLLFKT